MTRGNIVPDTLLLFINEIAFKLIMRIFLRIFIGLVAGIIILYLFYLIDKKYQSSLSPLFWATVFIINLLIGFLFNKKKKDSQILCGIAFFIFIQLIIYLIPKVYYGIHHLLK